MKKNVDSAGVNRTSEVMRRIDTIDFMNVVVNSVISISRSVVCVIVSISVGVSISSSAVIVVIEVN